MEEVDDISLTKVDIPMIINAVRSNFCMEGTTYRMTAKIIHTSVSRLISFMCIVVAISC